MKGFYYIPPLGDAGITLMSTVEAGGPSADSPWSFSKSSERVDPKRRYFQLRKKTRSHISIGLELAKNTVRETGTGYVRGHSLTTLTRGGG